MSHYLGGVGQFNVGAFCGPVGRTESYQIDGPEGMIRLTWEEFSKIKQLIERGHCKNEPTRDPRNHPPDKSSTGNENARQW